MKLVKNMALALLLSGAANVCAMEEKTTDAGTSSRLPEAVSAEDKRIIDMHRKILSARTVRSLKQDESPREGSGSEPAYMETGESCVMVTSRSPGEIAILEKQESLRLHLKTRMQQDTQVHYIYGDAVKDEIERIVKGYNDTIYDVAMSILSKREIRIKQEDGSVVTERVAGIGQYADGSVNTSGVIQYVGIPSEGIFAILPI